MLIDMKKCYEYFACKKIECVMFTIQDDKPCWDIIETLYCFPGVNVIDKTDEKGNCEFCLYKINNDINYKH